MSTDLHLMHHIANVIENLERRDLDPKLDKNTLFLEIIKNLFPNLSTDHMMFLDNFADFICASNLVNKISTVSKVLCSVKNNCIHNYRSKQAKQNQIISKSKSKYILSTNKKIRAGHL